MRFLLDVCSSSRSLQAALTEWGHDVVSVVSIDPRATDERLLALALTQSRILVTADKDFGELVFVHGHRHGTVVRMVDMTVSDQVEACRELLKQHADALTDDSIITISAGRIRIRRNRK